ncbi:zinc-binding dehydrogenase [Lasiosphaeris hirsuta]|uniref:Zinc-binding dehydrogenase n=1 Tax=Lasiosphaeris hirsuta TaxID=260670 RepID=A0AA40A9J0_9PEZI|nr:zinc-binding dehydrogenase [Lasiosphaeris hirsuta]
MATTTIRKAVITHLATSPTDVSNITLTSASLAAPGRKQVQVRVLYSGFCGADVNMAHGAYPLQRRTPLTPGYALVGTVVGLGPGTSARFAPGDTVAAVTVYGAEAERANVAEHLLVRVPAEVAARDDLLQQVTALALDWNTAYGMVQGAGGRGLVGVRSADVQPGQAVFVHGLSGAVGQGLTALCLLRGAVVYGTASKRNHAALREAGVRDVFEYTNKDWIAAMKAVGGVDAVFDPLGFESWDESFSILKDKGLLLGYGGNQVSLSGSEEEMARSLWPYMGKLVVRGMLPFAGKRTGFYYIKPGTADCQDGLAALIELLREGKIKVPIKAVWDLTAEGLKEAHQSWGKMAGMGSYLIRVGAERA